MTQEKTINYGEEYHLNFTTEGNRRQYTDEEDYSYLAELPISEFPLLCSRAEFRSIAEDIKNVIEASGVRMMGFPKREVIQDGEGGFPDVSYSEKPIFGETDICFSARSERPRGFFYFSVRPQEISDLFKTRGRPRNDAVGASLLVIMHHLSPDRVNVVCDDWDPNRKPGEGASALYRKAFPDRALPSRG